MERGELKTILENHEKWLRGEDGGSRADLRDANLRGADLATPVPEIVPAAA